MKFSMFDTRNLQDLKIKFLLEVEGANRNNIIIIRLKDKDQSSIETDLNTTSIIPDDILKFILYQVTEFTKRKINSSGVVEYLLELLNLPAESPQLVLPTILVTFERNLSTDERNDFFTKIEKSNFIDRLKELYKLVYQKYPQIYSSTYNKAKFENYINDIINLI